jgi:hypothetical protein
MGEGWWLGAGKWKGRVLLFPALAGRWRLPAGERVWNGKAVRKAESKPRVIRTDTRHTRQCRCGIAGAQVRTPKRSLVSEKNQILCRSHPRSIQLLLISPRSAP